MFQDFLTWLNDFMYTYILIFLLVGCGLYYSIRTRFVQVRKIKDVLSILKEKANSDGSDTKQVSSFQALMISTASRVGTGNIAGIATAIAAGGPGAVFWMWLMAVIGGSSAFAESTLAQIYKVKDGADFRGGPSYYIERALHSRKLGILFSIALIACFSYGFNGLQSYNISSALPYYIANYNDTIWPAVFGLILAVLTGLVIFGGVHRIGFITSVIVPIMATCYILLGLFVTLTNITQLPGVFALIFSEALNPKAIAGGFAGSAVVIGIKRGLFSNEAGMGSTPHAHATAEVKDPCDQGIIAMMGVFIDTFIILTLTALVILSTGVLGNGQTGSELAQSAFNVGFGNFGNIFIALCMLFFAFTTIVGWYYFGEVNVRHLFGNGAVKVYAVIVVICVIIGSTLKVDLVWDMADMFNGLMVLPNLIALLGCLAIVRKLTKKSEKNKGK